MLGSLWFGLALARGQGSTNFRSLSTHKIRFSEVGTRVPEISQSDKDLADAARKKAGSGIALAQIMGVSEQTVSG